MNEVQLSNPEAIPADLEAIEPIEIVESRAKHVGRLATVTELESIKPDKPPTKTEQKRINEIINVLSEEAQQIRTSYEIRAENKTKPKHNNRRATSRPREKEDEDLVYNYLADIGRHPLLDKEDEKSLAQLIEFGGEANKFLENVKNGSLLLIPTQRNKLKKLVRYGEEAKEDFINCNLRLVVSIAKKYQSSGMPLLDLIQEGNLGLIHAVEKFDWRKGFKFSTYATWWVKQAITRGIANTGRTIRLPVHAGDTLARLHKARTRLEMTQGRQASIAELAIDLEMPEDKIEEVLRYAAEPISLDLPLNEEHPETTLADVASDRTSSAGYDQVEQKELSEILPDYLAVLKPREIEILVLRFGLDNGEARTLDEVAEIIGLTRERIRQIEKAAIGKLNHPSSGTRDLKVFLV